MNNRNLILIIVFITSLFFFSSCKKEKPIEEPPVTETPTGGLFLHLHTYIDNTEIDAYNTVYTSDDNRKISLSRAQLYLSDFRLVKPDDSEISVPGKKVLKVLENDVYFLGEVPVGNYKTMRFKVGFNPTENAIDPAISPDSAILNIPSMWMSSTPQPDGYVFVNLEGTIDTSASANGTISQMQPFSFHIGTNSHLTDITMPVQNYSVFEGMAHYQHIVADYYKLYDFLQLNNPANLQMKTVADNATSLGNNIAARIQYMFRYE